MYNFIPASNPLFCILKCLFLPLGKGNAGSLFERQTYRKIFINRGSGWASLYLSLQLFVLQYKFIAIFIHQRRVTQIIIHIGGWSGAAYTLC